MPLPRITGTFRVGTDYELRYAPSGIAVGSFRAVASSSKKDESAESGWVTTAEIWCQITLFGKAAENAASMDIVKGAQVDVLGSISTEEWETKEGEKRTTVKIVADAVGVREQRDRDGQPPAQREQARAGDPDPWGPAPTGDDGSPPF